MPDNNPSPAARGTVLLVEEERNVRALLDKFLSDRGYELLEARNSDEALTVCKEHQGPIDLMICDLIMPEMSGVELARILRKHQPKLKTLYLSSHSESSVIYHGIPLTDIRFLPKPFKLKYLIATVEEIMGNAPAGP